MFDIINAGTELYTNDWIPDGPSGQFAFQNVEVSIPDNGIIFISMSGLPVQFEVTETGFKYRNAAGYSGPLMVSWMIVAPRASTA